MSEWQHQCRLAYQTGTVSSYSPQKQVIVSENDRGLFSSHVKKSGGISESPCPKKLRSFYLTIVSTLRVASSYTTTIPVPTITSARQAAEKSEDKKSTLAGWAIPPQWLPQDSTQLLPLKSHWPVPQRRLVLWSECLCPSKIHKLKS